MERSAVLLRTVGSDTRIVCLRLQAGVDLIFGGPDGTSSSEAAKGSQFLRQVGPA